MDVHLFLDAVCEARKAYEESHGHKATTIYMSEETVSNIATGGVLKTLYDMPVRIALLEPGTFWVI